MSEKYGISMVQARRIMNDAYVKYYDARRQAEAEGKCLSKDRKMEHAVEHMRMMPYGVRA